MKFNKLILSTCLFASITSFGQVGIGTDVPSVTLDVKGKPEDASVTDGVLTPRIKGSELKAKNALYDLEQNGTLIFVTEADPNPSTKTINVKSEGYYYYDADNEVWQKLAIELPELSFTKIVFVNNENPNTATQFSDVSRYVVSGTGQSAVCQVNTNFTPTAGLDRNQNYFYVGQENCTNVSTMGERTGWYWNGEKYVNYVVNARTAWYIFPIQQDNLSNKSSLMWRDGAVSIGGAGNPFYQLSVLSSTSRLGRNNSAANTRFNLNNDSTQIPSLYNIFATMYNRIPNNSTYQLTNFIGINNQVVNETNNVVNSMAADFTLKNEASAGRINVARGINNRVWNLTNSSENSGQMVGIHNIIDNFTTTNGILEIAGIKSIVSHRGRVSSTSPATSTIHGVNNRVNLSRNLTSSIFPSVIGNETSVLLKNREYIEGNTGDIDTFLTNIQIGNLIGNRVYINSTSNGLVSKIIGEQIEITKESDGNGSISEVVGLEIKNVESGTTNYSIKTGKGIASFGDVVEAKEIKLNNLTTRPAGDNASNAGKIIFLNGVFEVNDGTGWKRIQIY